MLDDLRCRVHRQMFEIVGYLAFLWLLRCDLLCCEDNSSISIGPNCILAQWVEVRWKNLIL